MRRERRCLARIWGQERRVAVLMLAACLALAASGPLFAVFEVAGLRTVHVIYPRHPARLRLGPGTYALDQDPDATGFPVAREAVIITGRDGAVPASPTAYDISPADLGGLLLGVGTFEQAARFTIARTGVYHLTVTDPHAGARLYVSEPFTAAAIQAGPCAVTILAALATIALTARRLRAARAGDPPEDRTSRPGPRARQRRDGAGGPKGKERPVSA